MAAITDVCDLKPFKSIWKIRVKIVRLWKQYSAFGGVTIEMDLIDSNVARASLLFVFRYLKMYVCLFFVYCYKFM